MLLLVSASFASDVRVSDVTALRAAVDAAAPGDTLVLTAGTWRLDAGLTLAASGTDAAPITLRGEGTTIESDTVEALKVTGAHWHIEDLTMKGVCAVDSDCEHALHIVGAADGTWVRRMTLIDFNAQIKGNGEDYGDGYIWPDDVVIEGNDLHDTRPRMTENPVTKLDVVGGRRWRVEANRISDFEKGLGDTVSYAAFLKGNSKDGVFERNLVVCSEAFSGGVRLGLSFGGGGTSPDSICEDGTCTPEHQGGLMRNNLIVGCNDVGVYLNEAQDCAVLYNTLYETAGIDVRYEASTVEVDGNVLDGRIRERDDGSATLGENVSETSLDTVFADGGALDFTLRDGGLLVDAGSTRPEITDDWCGATRGDPPDLGALEYTRETPCDTTTPQAADDEQETGATLDTGADDGDPKGGGEGCGCSSPGAAGPIGLFFAMWGTAATRRSARNRGHTRG